MLVTNVLRTGSCLITESEHVMSVRYLAFSGGDAEVTLGLWQRDVCCKSAVPCIDE